MVPEKYSAGKSNFPQTVLFWDGCDRYCCMELIFMHWYLIFTARIKDNDCDRIVKGKTFLYLLPRRQGMEIRGGVPPSEVCLSMKMVFVASM